MKPVLFIVTITFGLLLHSQVDDPYIERLKKQYENRLNLNCDVVINVDVEGIIIPKKTINLRFVNNEPIISGEGISLLPKKGIINQFNELLASPFQAIFLSKRKNNRIYKLVSLDEKSDWITADIEFDEQSLLVFKATVNTRKFGAFNIHNSYAESDYPSETRINFNIKKFKLPLKFIGRTNTSVDSSNNDETIEGTVYLYYTYLD
ncbi:MAG: hypothetical protein NWP87_04740 [Winogradskyella sp.]|nr:hypothetical protein [Winogradskyella sp.]